MAPQPFGQCSATFGSLSFACLASLHRNKSCPHKHKNRWIRISVRQKLGSTSAASCLRPTPSASRQIRPNKCSPSLSALLQVFRIPCLFLSLSLSLLCCHSEQLSQRHSCLLLWSLLRRSTVKWHICLETRPSETRPSETRRS